MIMVIISMSDKIANMYSAMVCSVEYFTRVSQLDTIINGTVETQGKRVTHPSQRQLSKCFHL